MTRKKKSKYKHVIINKKKYYFYTIDFKKTKKFVWTFSSYDTNDEVFSDRNIMPIGCILKMTKLVL